MSARRELDRVRKELDRVSKELESERIKNGDIKSMIGNDL
jgi:hypothetical protein